MDIIIFGGGVAGLTAAHELIKRGHTVRVIEANEQAGGFFRSDRRESMGWLPTEYSWHGFGPWYHNTFDIMKEIPFDADSSVYDRALSRPVNYGVLPDAPDSDADPESMFSAWTMFRMSTADKLRGGWLMLKAWAAGRRSVQRYALQNAAEAWKPTLSETGWKTWRACFGPWVGSDYNRVSLHHVGEFFKRNFMSGPSHEHGPDEEGGPWTHGSGDGWLLLRGPSNAVWFDKWVDHLSAQGVRFSFCERLERLETDGQRITGARLASGEVARADRYILAVGPYPAAKIVADSGDLAQREQLSLLAPLTADPPHTQVSFRLAFSQPVRWPLDRSGLVLADSPFNLTLFAQEQAWLPGTDLGEGVRSLWTGTSCTGVVAGSLHGKPVNRCTKEEFVEEVLAQLSRCEGLDLLLRTANNGQGFAELPLEKIEVWPEWDFSPDGIEPEQPKWVNSTRTRPYRPTQRTPVDNLLLAGAHTLTEADIWSVEGAVESGRRAARLISPDVPLRHQHTAGWLRVLNGMDDALYSLRLPHVLDVLLLTLALAVLVGIIALLG